MNCVSHPQVNWQIVETVDYKANGKEDEIYVSKQQCLKK